MWACGAAGSALPWHGRGRRFDPDQVHQLHQQLGSTSPLRLCRIFVANSKTTPRTGAEIAPPGAESRGGFGGGALASLVATERRASPWSIRVPAGGFGPFPRLPAPLNSS